MKVYVATGLSNVGEYVDVCRLYREAGWTITYDWSTTGDLRKAVQEVRQLVALKEYEGVRTADIVVILVPGRRGTHVELGFAIAHDKPVILYHKDDDNLDTIFYSMPNVRLVNRSVGYMRLLEESKSYAESYVRMTPAAIQQHSAMISGTSSVPALLCALVDALLPIPNADLGLYYKLRDSYRKNRELMYRQHHTVVDKIIEEKLGLVDKESVNE